MEHCNNHETEMMDLEAWLSSEHLQSQTLIYLSLCNFWELGLSTRRLVFARAVEQSINTSDLL